MASVTYNSNNSGGSWWLNDDDWKNLAEAGWEVAWFANNEYYKDSCDSEGRWLGALASEATKHDSTMREAIAEWESITGEDSSALGCSCCGTPHSFSSDDGEYYSPSYPAYGDRY